jgi:hypothetical protein
VEDLLVRQQNSRVREKIGQLKVQTDLVWGTYVSEGKFTPARTWKWLFDLIDQGKALLAVDYVPCLDQTGVASLRQACVEAYMAGYGYNPTGWATEWERVWPDVRSPVATAFVMPPKLAISAADTNRAKVAADLAAVDKLVQVTKTALDKQDVVWAKANVESVRQILVDGSGTQYVHAARVGGAIPQGVTGQAFGLLQKAAKALYGMLPGLNRLAQQPVPKPKNIVLPPGFVFGSPGAAADPGATPAEPPGWVVPSSFDSFVQDTKVWITDHPWLTVAGLGAAGYLAWRQWGR